MSSEPSLMELVLAVAAAWEQHRSASLDRAGFPSLSGTVLPLLHTIADRDITVEKLAARHDLPVPDVARHVGALEARSYVRRPGPAGDIRHRTVRVTTAGRAALAADLELTEQWEVRFDAVDVSAGRRTLTGVLEDLLGQRESAQPRQ